MLSQVFGLEKIVNTGQLRFLVIDGSTVQAPGAKGTSYRLHIAVDLVNLELVQVKVTDASVGESLAHYELYKGYVVLIDRGYNQAKSLVPLIAQGIDVVLRYNPHGMNVYTQDEAMTKLDWSEQLQKLNNQAGYFDVYLCDENQRIKATVHATPLPPEQAEEARRRTRQTAQKNGRTPKANTLYLSGWVLVFTTLSVKSLDTQTIAALYRVRWQIELVIKRLKSLLKIDCLRAKLNSKLAELYLYGKLLYAAVVEKLLKRQGLDRLPLGIIPERTLTPWRLWHLLSCQIDAALMVSMAVTIHHTHAFVKAISERRRKRKLQTLPDKVFQLSGIYLGSRVNIANNDTR